MKSMIRSKRDPQSRFNLVIALGALVFLTVGACQLFQPVSDPPEAFPTAAVAVPTVEESNGGAVTAGGGAPAASTSPENIQSLPEVSTAENGEPDLAAEPPSFSMATASRNLPGDIMAEVAVWTGGGGPGDDIPPGYRLVIEDGFLFLRGFVPNERVRVFAYENSTENRLVPAANLVAWQEYQVDSAGNLDIKTEEQESLRDYVVVGDVTGEVGQFGYYGLVKESILASAPRISNFQVCLQPCNGVNSVNEVPGGTTELFIHWEYHNIPVGSNYSRVWGTYLGEWVRYECTWQGPESGVVDISLREPAGMFSSSWDIQITVDGQQLLDWYVIVTGDWEYWDPAGTFYSCY